LSGRPQPRHGASGGDRRACVLVRVCVPVLARSFDDQGRASILRAPAGTAVAQWWPHVRTCGGGGGSGSGEARRLRRLACAWPREGREEVVVGRKGSQRQRG
jgi:hypothetical protein